jgi:hypothetical protein
MFKKMHDQNKFIENFIPNPTHHNLQLILRLHYNVKVLDPWSLTSATFFSLNLYVSINFVKFIAKVCPLIYVALKRLRVMWFGYQLAFKKSIINAKITYPPFDIHKSKLVVIEWHFAKDGKTYNYLVFSIKPINNSWKYSFWKEKQVFNTNAY